MTGAWTHACCDRCWVEHYADKGIPHRLREPDEEQCAYCGATTMSGIYVRINPKVAEAMKTTWKDTSDEPAG